MNVSHYMNHARGLHSADRILDISVTVADLDTSAQNTGPGWTQDVLRETKSLSITR